MSSVAWSPARRSLDRALEGYARAYQIRAALLWGPRLMAVGFGLDAAAMLAGRFWPLPFPLALLALPPLVGAIAGALLGGTRAPRRAWLARQVDRQLGLHERALTAVELSGRRGESHPLAAAQVDDALAYLRGGEPLEAFPPRVPRREAIALGACALLLVPLLLVAPPRESVQSAPRLDQVARGEAERIDAVADEIERDEPPTPDDQINAQVASVLRDAAEGLRDPTAPDQQMARIGDAERRLSSLQSPTAFDTTSALSRLADAMDRDQRTRSVAEALDRRDYQGASDQLRQLGEKAASGSEADRQAIASALRQAAATTSRYDQRLSDALRQASDQAAAGQQGGTEAAAQELDRAGAEMRRQDTLERALSQLQNSRQTLGDATGQRAGSPGERAGASPQDRGDGQSQSGDRGGEGRPHPGPLPGGEGTSGGDQPGSGAGTGSSPRTTDVYDPAATRARQVQVPGGDFDRPQVGPGGDQSDGGDGEVTVDYRDVLPTYQERATRAMQDRYVPLGMKELVKQYFSALGSSGQ